MTYFAEPHRLGWQIVDSDGKPIDKSNVVYFNKRAAVAAIRAFDFSLPASTRRDLPRPPASLD